MSFMYYFLFFILNFTIYFSKFMSFCLFTNAVQNPFIIPSRKGRIFPPQIIVILLMLRPPYFLKSVNTTPAVRKTPSAYLPNDIYLRFSNFVPFTSTLVIFKWDAVSVSECIDEANDLQLLHEFVHYGHNNNDRKFQNLTLMIFI